MITNNSLNNTNLKLLQRVEITTPVVNVDFTSLEGFNNYRLLLSGVGNDSTTIRAYIRVSTDNGATQIP